MSSLIGSTSSFLDDVLQDRRLHFVVGHQLIQRATETSFFRPSPVLSSDFIRHVFAISRLENLPVLRQYRPSVAFLLYAVFA
jgi:hypothetical protein